MSYKGKVMQVNTQNPVYAAAKRLVMTIQSGDEHGAAHLLVQRVKLEIKKQEIKESEKQLKQEFDSLYINNIKPGLDGGAG